MSQTYAQYINGPLWQQKRLERLRYDNFKCVQCHDTERLEVHHVLYERLGNERLEDVLTLCANCHARTHGRDPDLPKTFTVAEAFWRSCAIEIEKEALEDEQAEILAYAMDEAGIWS